MAGRFAPTTIVRSGARGCRSYCPRHPVQQCAQFAWDKIAPKQCARPPAARQRSRPDAENFGGEGLFLTSLTTLHHLVGAGEESFPQSAAPPPFGRGLEYEIGI